MTNVTTLIDNASPLITYLPPGAWQFRTPSDPADAGMDAQYARYSMGGTFTVTTTDAASASFTFNGTSVTLYGANRPNHGFYNITLDGASQGSFNGSTNNSIGVWGPLYSSGELEEGSHTVIVSNDPVDGNHNWLDLDYITFSTSATIQTSLVQDTDPSFAYQGSGWSDTVAYQNEYNGTSGHISCDNEASAVYTFQGKGTSRGYEGNVTPSS
ncbi:hypothetical protein OE88DRAFT_264911 [Heliocybe sulcata]|uniref:Uncharacterized protein n=1 Tax=Heliocybe sulcata TaxID=5364 RepID=A0A5C3N0H0_9AGAM|nr:hypothetical protein OE88DRAFT_264911 [Heliocybe sulcata]